METDKQKKKVLGRNKKKLPPYGAAGNANEAEADARGATKKKMNKKPQKKRTENRPLIPLLCFSFSPFGWVYRGLPIFFFFLSFFVIFWLERNNENKKLKLKRKKFDEKKKYQKLHHLKEVLVEQKNPFFHPWLIQTP